jgi:hypothetical protein
MCLHHADHVARHPPRPARGSRYRSTRSLGDMR